MKFSNRVIYFVTTVVSYVFLTLLEFFVLDNLDDIFSTKFKIHLIMMIICLVIINPLITYLFIGTLPLKPSLKLKGDIKEDLKRHD